MSTLLSGTVLRQGASRYSRSRRQDPPRHAPHRARHGRRPRCPHPPRPDPSRPLLLLAVAKILRALALQESPGLLILGKQVRTPRPSQIRLNSVSFSPDLPCLSRVV
ncbi:hypothetical protein ZWY2020_047174 [Hordeum vulgare]|nr:hypothetical protein ZWY2020_047174 [Hordeum vulgare]